MNMSRRTLLQWGVGSAATAVLGFDTSGSAGATDVFKRRFAGDPGPGRLYYGASTEQNLADWETQMGQRLALHRSYFKPKQAGRLVRVAKADLAAGRMPHVSIKVPGTWLSVARGRHDPWLRNISGGLARLNRPVFLTFHHEPENDVRRKGSPADFVSMQTHIIRLFANRAPKVTIIPILQGWSFSAYNKKAKPALWYVPAAKVYGVDVYNPFCTTDPKWVSFAEKLNEIKKYAHGKPIAIGEYGCRNDPDNPDRGGEWMHDAFRYARHNNIVSMSYFNSGRNSPEGSWALDGTRSAVFQSRLASDAVARPA
jgi:hypothetical protein